MTVECGNCGESFDPNRDGVVAGQDTSRCPSCGQQATSSSDESVALSLGEDGGEVHIHIHVHRG